jgi:hypothetical protein
MFFYLTGAVLLVALAGFNMLAAIWGAEGPLFGTFLAVWSVLVTLGAIGFYRMHEQAEGLNRTTVLSVWCLLFLGMVSATKFVNPFGIMFPKPPEVEPLPPEVTKTADGEQWAVPHAPPGPAKLSHVPDNVLELIALAQQTLRTQKMDVGECGGKGVGQAQCLCDYLLAVTDNTGQITLVEAYQEQESRPAGYRVRAQINPGFERACGTNPVLDVTHPPGQTVLAVRTVVKTTRLGSEAAVFTPFTDELNTPELRERGLSHWWGNVVAAHQEMRALNVASSHVKGKLVSDLIPLKHVFLLGIIENVGALSPFGERGSEEQRLRELHAVLVMYGANGAETFKWRVSRADAYGPLQFTSIYKGLREQYPGVLPEGDWIAGAKDHRLAARAAFLHSDEEFRPLKKDWHVELPKHPLLYGLYLAAGYNGSARRVARALENCSAEEWYAVTCPTLRGRDNEGHWYMRKYLGVEPMLFDAKTHARLKGLYENASAPDEGKDTAAER